MEISRSRALVTKALDIRAMRQDMISSNIANVDTPFFRPKDVRFEEALANEAKKLKGGDGASFKLKRTHPAHIEHVKDENSDGITTFYRDGHMARNDGNSVDLDVETTELAKNSIMYNALTAALSKHGRIFRSVIEYSGKLQ